MTDDPADNAPLDPADRPPSEPPEHQSADAPVVVEEAGASTAAEVLAALDAQEAARGASLVDEAEHVRLRRFVDTGERAEGWQALAARRPGPDEALVGYAAVVLTDAGVASGDVAVLAGTPAHPATETLKRLLAALAERAEAAAAVHLQMWVRLAGAPEIDAAHAAGFTVARRLGVLGTSLDDVEVVPPPEHWTIRPYRPDVDDEAVVAVLAGAYEGTDEAGWTLQQFQERRAYDWFRPEDLLLAEDATGHLGGLHWLKRRTDAEGEVYNLAIAPSAQGAGLGGALLTAGLAHLRDVGCLDVVLWVDRANERAVRLYERYGFTTRWDDIAFGRPLGG
ncbi:GNAT family N-acetyltransferase [Egicoccus sp. AB-alg2]|uniref:GNAT family N-acetyltransferase n=1 Tax=Egicoccus sp. AB-alg2 TaxID=3242693 RepID=UPI00359E1A2D